jgi:hypothetical protein
MHDESLDFVFFDAEDIDWVLIKFSIYQQAAQILGKHQLEEEERSFLRAEAVRFFDALNDKEINRLGGEAAGIISKYHYKLNKAIPALLEFVVVEAGAIAAAAITPPLGIMLGVGGPAIGIFGKWREVITTLDHDEILVLRTMSDLIKSDYRILREKGVTESEIREALQRAGLSVPDLSGCLENLCGDLGEKKVVVKTRGSGGVFRYTPIP